MLRLNFLVILFLLGPAAGLHAADHHWSLDSVPPSEIEVYGNIQSAVGVTGRCAVFDGNTMLKVRDSAALTSGESGFSFTAWVNPYRCNSGQQMIAAKNRYSLNERQWGVMVDNDGRFRLYIWQGRWAKAACSEKPIAGHWYQVGVVVQSDQAELWVNGRLADQVSLSKPIPQSQAPITLGGINDNGRVRQNFVGAIDEVRVHDRPLGAEQMAALFHPVQQTHQNPVLPEPFQLWSGGRLPATSKVTLLKGVEFSVIKKFERNVDGYGFLHGVALAWHHGKLYASFAHNKGPENTLTEEARFCVSDDGGKTWSKVQTIDVGTEEKDLAVSHGVFLSHGETLWAFLGSFYQTRQRVHTRAYTLDESTGQWKARGTVVGDGFWPMTEPVKMANGNWIMPGFIVGDGNPAAVAISEGDNLNRWNAVRIPVAAGIQKMWGESSIIVDGSTVVNIARYGSKPLALAAKSFDYGETWTPSRESNLPMATSKPCSGVLSNGMRYLIGSTTADGGQRRSPLTIALSKPGTNLLSRVFVIRHAVFDAGPGESHSNAALSYPYATEYQGKLFVGYSNNGPRRANNNSAELAVIPLESLEFQPLSGKR